MACSHEARQAYPPRVAEGAAVVDLPGGPPLPAAAGVGHPHRV